MYRYIKASGCNVLLIQKSILRDAVTDLSLHYLAKVRETEEREGEGSSSRTLGSSILDYSPPCSY